MDFFDFIDDKVVVSHVRKLEYSKDPALDIMFLFPGYVSYTPEAVILYK